MKFFLRTLAGPVGFLAGFVPGGMAAVPADRVLELDEMRVSATPLRAVEEMAQPVIVLEEADLLTRRAATLGETLEGLPGVADTAYFPGASRPIVRGFSNHRVRVLRGGLDTIDASAGSLDHAVALEPYRVERVDIIRGPAALLHGGGAVGGVINTFDQSIPRQAPEAAVSGRVDADWNGAADGTTGSLFLQTGGGAPFSFTAGGLRRRSGDLSIPGFGATDPQLRDGQPRGTLGNSHVNTGEWFAGGSWFLPGGWLGGAVSRYRTNYGLGREVENEAVGTGPDGELIVNREFEDFVAIDLDQKRFDLHGEWGETLEFWESASFRLGLADYEHAELEDGEVATVFRNRGFDGRLELAARPPGDWQGGIGFDLGHSRFSATGDEAFLRPTDTWKAGLFALAERPVGAVTWQTGARVEHQRISPRAYERDELPGAAGVPSGHREFGGSAASGVLWDFAQGWNLGFTASYTERLPNPQELYADGPHVGTFAYEISDHPLGAFTKERSLGLDLTVRRTSGRVTGEWSGFAQLFPDFVTLRQTGELAFENQDGTFTIRDRAAVDDAFLDDRRNQDEGNGFLNVTRHQMTRALFAGTEARVVFHLMAEPDQEETPNRTGEPTLDWIWQADWVRAVDRRENEPLPRMPPLRVGTELRATWDGWFAGVDARHVTRQTRTALFETGTGSHTLVGLTVGRDLEWRGTRLHGFVRLSNLLNNEVRQHTSFVKDHAPLAGRAARAGVGMEF